MSNVANDEIYKDSYEEGRKAGLREVFESLCFMCRDADSVWSKEPVESGGGWRHELKVGSDLPAQPCRASYVRETLKNV